MGTFVINSIISGVVVYNYSLGNQTTTTIITNILFMVSKLGDVYVTVNTEQNIFYSAYLKGKIQYNGVDPDKLKVLEMVDIECPRPDHVEQVAAPEPVKVVEPEPVKVVEPEPLKEEEPEPVEPEPVEPEPVEPEPVEQNVEPEPVEQNVEPVEPEPVEQNVEPEPAEKVVEELVEELVTKVE